MPKQRKRWPVGEFLNCTNEPNEDVKSLPFYHYVPKDMAKNLRWRLALEAKCETDPEFREAVLWACSQDVLFFLNTFCLIYEPRPDDDLPDTWVPFLTWTSQDIFLTAIDKYLGKREIGIEKSRAQGASWLVLMLFLWHWLFNPKTVAFGLVSSKEDLVANDDDPDSLFWKIDGQLSWLPSWMIPWFDARRDRSKSNNSLTHPIKRSTMVGVAATKAAFVGGRKTAVLWDEAADFPENAAEDALRGTQHVSRGRIILSTPESDQDWFHRVMHTPSTMLKIRIHWSENPMHGRGKYRILDDGEIELLDPGYDYEGYEFVREPKIGGRLRSPWYDEECLRPGATPQAIAKELDINYGSAAYKFFGELALPLRWSREKLGPPKRGRFTIDDEALMAAWEPGRGNWKMWLNLDSRGAPPASQYVVGCDIAAGNATDFSSNSAVVVFDRNTGLEVLEYAYYGILPSDFAELVVSVCHWLGWGSNNTHPYLIWDANGQVASGFTTYMLAGKGKDYYPMYRRGPHSHKRIRSKKYTDIPGWLGNTAELLPWFRDGLFSQRITVSEDIIRECNGWEFTKGKAVYVPSVKTQAEDAMGDAHGDLVTAATLAYRCFKEIGSYEQEIKKKAPPEGSIAWYEQREEEARHRGYRFY